MTLMRCKKGNITILLAFVIMTICVAGGVGVDYSRAYHARSELTKSVDAALLAASRVLLDNKTDAEAIAVAHAIFKANLFGAAGKENLAFADVQLVDPVIIWKPDRSSFTISVIQKDIPSPTSMAKVFGIDKINIGVNSTTTGGVSKLEVALALDTTGSMSVGVRMRELQLAAKKFNEIILARNGARVAVVPYNTAVNVGDEMFPKVTGDPLVVDNCVFEREGDLYEEAPPQVNNNYLLYKGKEPVYFETTCTMDEVVPLTSEEGLLTEVIDSFRSGGNTAIHLGLQWGWYVLSPSWSDILPAGSSPAKYEDVNTQKVLVIMTDGDTNTMYGRGTFRTRDVSAKMCEQIKARGIRIFVVGLSIIGTHSETLLRGCASNKDSVMLVNLATELTYAFEEIARRLTTVRVTH